MELVVLVSAIMAESNGKSCAYQIPCVTRVCRLAFGDPLIRVYRVANSKEIAGWYLALFKRAGDFWTLDMGAYAHTMRLKRLPDE